MVHAWWLQKDGMEWDALVREMITFARGHFEEEGQCCSVDNVEKVQRLWNEWTLWSRFCAGVLVKRGRCHVIPMLAVYRMAAGQAGCTVRVWMIAKKGVGDDQVVYPEGKTRESRKVVDLLKSNKIVEPMILT